MSNLHHIDAQVHMQVANGAYRIKVSILDLGLYLNGVLAYPPNGEHEEWWVNPPAQRKGKGYFYPAEFNKKETLWLEIQQACIEAVQLELLNDAASGVDDIEDWSEEKLRENLDKAFPDE